MSVAMPADLAVLGLGHSGLPVAQAALAAGIATIGYDPDEQTVADLNAGEPPSDGTLSAAELRRMIARGFRASTDPAVLSRVRTALICAPTSLGPDRALNLSAVRTAAHTLASQLRPRTTVVLESAVYPGSTEEILRPLLEEGSGLRAGRDFHLAYSPARIGPRQPRLRVRQHPQGHRRTDPGVHGGRRRLLRAPRGQGRTRPRPARGRGDTTAGDQLPPGQHRVGERDGRLLPRRRRRPVGRHPLRRDQAVRVPGVPARAPASAATASPSTPTTWRTAAVRSAIRCAWSSSPRRSTGACRAMSHSGRRRCSTRTASPPAARTYCCWASPTSPTCPTRKAHRHAKSPCGSSSWARG